MLAAIIRGKKDQLFAYMFFLDIILIDIFKKRIYNHHLFNNIWQWYCQ